MVKHTSCWTRLVRSPKCQTNRRHLETMDYHLVGKEMLYYSFFLPSSPTASVCKIFSWIVIWKLSMLVLAFLFILHDGEEKRIIYSACNTYTWSMISLFIPASRNLATLSSLWSGSIIDRSKLHMEGCDCWFHRIWRIYLKTLLLFLELDWLSDLRSRVIFCGV